jgi:methionine synthase II (cobalamin-independent)
MAYGFDRFLTTHTGSLPRPDDLIRAMFAKEEGVPVDRAALAARISKAVAEVVKKQVGSSVDLVNDGEMSKPSYATYVKDRLTGFAGSSNTFVYQDLAEFPNLIAGDGTKNGFLAPNKEPATNQKQLLDRKSPIQVRILLPSDIGAPPT